MVRKNLNEMLLIFILALGLFGYLLYVLLKPEKF